MGISQSHDLSCKFDKLIRVNLDFFFIKLFRFQDSDHEFDKLLLKYKLYFYITYIRYFKSVLRVLYIVYNFRCVLLENLFNLCFFLEFL